MLEIAQLVFSEPGIVYREKYDQRKSAGYTEHRGRSLKVAQGKTAFRFGNTDRKNTGVVT